MTLHRNARLVIACAASALGLAAGANAASAAPAAFSATGGAALASSGNLVFQAGTTPDPQRTFTCAGANIQWQSPPQPTVTNSPTGVGILSGIPFGASPCYNGYGQFAYITMSVAPGLEAAKNGGVFSLSSTMTMGFTINGIAGLFASNHGQVSSYTARWVNGTGPTAPSVLTFNNAPIGKVSNSDSGIQGQPIKLTGSIKVSRSGGTLLTLS